MFWLLIYDLGALLYQELILSFLEHFQSPTLYSSVNFTGLNFTMYLLIIVARILRYQRNSLKIQRNFRQRYNYSE